MSNQTLVTDFFGPATYVYSRQNAIDDGVLVDLSNSKEVRELGYNFPVAATRAVWENYIEWTDEDSKRQCHQDQTGRLYDILFMASMAIKISSRIGSQFIFELYCVPRKAGSKARKARLTKLKMIVGPGDTPEPVITILLPNED